MYDTIRNNDGWDNFKMTPIEEYKCDTPLHARMSEQYWIENIQENKLNNINAFITMEQRIEQKKEYYNANKEN